jgi:hypothetical protein
MKKVEQMPTTKAKKDKKLQTIKLNEPFKFDKKVYRFIELKGKKVIELLIDNK